LEKAVCGVAPAEEYVRARQVRHVIAYGGLPMGGSAHQSSESPACRSAAAGSGFV
jgi:hypothetical protein